VQSECVYQGCTGVAVPGDYATIQSAVSALAPVGGTICLTAPSYTESVTVSGTESVTIQGISATKTTLNGDQMFGLPIHLQGFQVIGNVTVAAGPSTLENMTVVEGPGEYGALGLTAGDMTVTASKIVGTGVTPAVYLFDQVGSTIVLEGVDISSPQGTAFEPDGSSFQVTVQDSYIHDSARGLAIVPNDSTFTIVNNTFANAGDALTFACDPVYHVVISALTYENNLFVDSQLAVFIDPQCVAGQPYSFASNGFFANTTNFSGTAVEGAGDVKSDPLLQTNVTPPALGAGSPARGAGNKQVAPPNDYWGNPRGASVDLGCIQSP
jgi:hypothetical protein